MTIIGQKNNYRTICESVGIESFECRPVGAPPSINSWKKLSIIADEPRQVTIDAINWVCRKLE